jgi:hypothetical protein
MTNSAESIREPRGWKELAWNGVRAVIPPAWEPGQIGARHLLIESETGPAMEIKWSPVRGHFSHRRHFKRLQNVTAARGAHARECTLPAEWKAALGRWEPTGFCWTAGGAAATGAILYCPRSRTGGLVQFFHVPGDPNAVRRGAVVLKHLRFHDGTGLTPWAVFDIRAELPERFALVRHRFEPGRFTLRFSSGRCRIDLYRWAPAAVLLKERTLGQFAQAVEGVGALRFQALDGTEPAMVEGCTPAATGILERFAAGFGLRSVCRARLWHLPEHNRILGLRMEDRGAIDSNVWEAVSRAYGVVGVKAAAESHPPR